MKRKSLLLVSVLFLILSCSKEEISKSQSTDNLKQSREKNMNLKKVASIDTLQKEKFFTLSELDSLISLDFKDYRKMKEGEELSILASKNQDMDFAAVKSSVDWEGPFTVISEQTKIQDDELLLITDAPLLATGYYFCDVYLNRAEVELPVNSVGRAEAKTIYNEDGAREWGRIQ